MDNVRNCDSYINIPSSQTYRSFESKIISGETERQTSPTFMYVSESRREELNNNEALYFPGFN
jgi:hypothetical protein